MVDEDQELGQYLSVAIGEEGVGFVTVESAFIIEVVESWVVGCGKGWLAGG